MNISDTNFRTIEAFDPTHLSSNEEYLWKLGAQLEDMPCLFKIARIFSCFLKCLYLDHWYLKEIATVYEESLDCLEKKADKEITIPILKTEMIGIKHSEDRFGRSFLDFHNIKNIIDLQQKINGEATQLLNAGIKQDVVDAGITAFCLLGCRDRSAFHLSATVAPKEIERIRNVLLSEGNIPQAVAIACQDVSHPSTSVQNLEKEIREKLQRLLDAAPANQAVWLEKIKDLPEEYRAQFSGSEEFSSVFLGLLPSSDQTFKKLVQEYNQVMYTKYAVESPKTTEELAKRRAVLDWIQEVRTSMIIFKPDAIEQRIKEIYTQILENAPKEKAQFLSYTEGLAENFRKRFFDFLERDIGYSYHLHGIIPTSKDQYCALKRAYMDA